jgi:hypothetical protein
MNESHPEISPVASPLESHKDRSTGLTIFGILTIMLGCLAALLIPLMLFGQMSMARTTGAPVRLSIILPGALTYGLMAVALVWLGIGSIKARRWARALLLIFSWSWLVVGLCIIGGMAIIMPQMMATLSASGPKGQPVMTSSVVVAMLVFMFVFYGVLFVILPAIWTFFYSSRHVKATCEARDPVPHWTDACPLPVLALCLWLVFSGAMMLVVPLTSHGLMPCFGIFLTGLPGTLLCLSIAAIWIFSGWRLYQLDVRAWWLIFVILVLWTVSVLLTFAHHDFLEMYQLMGYPEAQLEQIKKSGIFEGNRMNWMMSLSALPFLGYLLFIKKYLGRKS